MSETISMDAELPEEHSSIQSQLDATVSPPLPSLSPSLPSSPSPKISPSIEQEILDLRRSEAAYHQLVKGLPDEYLFYTTEPDGVLLDVSPSIEPMLGYCRDEVIGHNWREFFDLEIPANLQLEEIEIDRFTSDVTGPYECLVQHAQGGTRHLELISVLIRDPESGKSISQGIAKDVTERRQAEEALRQTHDELQQKIQQRTEELQRTNDQLQQSEERYRSVVEGQIELIVRWLPDGTRTFANSSYRCYFGIADDNMLAESFMPLVHEEDREAVREKIAALTPENPVAVDEHRVLRRDGQIAWQQWSDCAIFDAAGELVEYQSVGRDISELKQAEATRRERAVAQTKLENLSPRECEVMELVVDGMANKVIASRLEVSIKTVEKHRASVMKKLGVRALPDLVRLALSAARTQA